VRDPGAPRPRTLWPGSLPLGARRPQDVGGRPVPRGDSWATPFPPTSSGLARRAPAGREVPDPAPMGDDMLAALRRYAPPEPGPVAPTGDGPTGRSGPTGPTGRTGASGPPPGRSTPPGAGPRAFAPGVPGVPGVPSGVPPVTPSDALTRRVRGAQLPQTSVVSLHGRGPRPRTGIGPSPTARAPLTPGPSRATDVRTLLTSFTAGVQRGLADARNADRPPGDDRGG
jgi:hypothetical protein